MTIEAGDLVVVVRAKACGCTDNLGTVFRVAILKRAAAWQGWHCRSCGASGIMAKPGSGYANDANGSFGHWGIAVKRLIKIDPPALPESIERKESVDA